MVFVAAYTLTRPDPFQRTAEARQLDPAAVRVIVAHRTDCPDFRYHPYHFIIGNGVLYGDGEVVETEAWRGRTAYPDLHDRDARRRTVAVGIVVAGRAGPTSAQRGAVLDLSRHLQNSYTLRAVRVIEHVDLMEEGCRVGIWKKPQRSARAQF